MKKNTVKKATVALKQNETKSSSNTKELSIIDRANEILSKEKDASNDVTNEFVRMQEDIASRIVEYDRVRKECNINDPAHSATIHRLAKPFFDGYFTLAVVGKMSSGKSTFINTLIGDNLFPTGHFQTTSTLTFIEKGDEVKMDVLFYDGHKETISNDTEKIKKRLKQLVSIPEEYHSLPINDINTLILGDDDIEEILKKKEGIEVQTLTSSDEELWRKYVKTHDKKDLVEKVCISYPLPAEYQGWRIVDTPGIGATGGIQDETKMLFAEDDDDNNKIIDAIVFLHSGTDNIEDEAARSFMDRLVKGLTEDAKKRLFFVLTKSSDTSFRSHKAEILQKAKELYAKVFRIPEERFTYIDSLLERFNNEVKDKKYFDELKCPSNWETDEWEQMTDLYTPIKKQISKNGKEMTNTAVQEIMKEWSNFEILKSLLNKFVRDEKSVSRNKIISLIEEDCLGFTKNFRYQINVLEGKKDIQQEREKLSKEKIKHNNLLNQLKREASINNIWPQFSFIDDEIGQFSSESSIDLIRTAYFNLIQNVKNKERDIFEGFKTKYNDYFKNKESDDDYPGFDTINWDELEREADEKCKEEVTDYDKPEVESPFFKKKVIYPHKKTIRNLDKKRKDFANAVVKKARKSKEKFNEGLESKINEYYNLISQELEKRHGIAINQLIDLEKKMADRNKEISLLRNKLEVLENRKR